ncbi:MAG: hypothetical protein QG608_3295 [Actinomycetota bacterium]|nr:hypothetical protein [Actinomycetota bacterium]
MKHSRWNLVLPRGNTGRPAGCFANLSPREFHDGTVATQFVRHPLYQLVPREENSVSTTRPNGSAQNGGMSNGSVSNNDNPSGERSRTGTPAPGDSGVRGRRVLLTAGAAAALGAVGVATARPSQAASSALMTETTNSAVAPTSLYATASGSAFTVYQKGSGNGAFLVSDNTVGFTGKTLSENSWAGLVQNAGTASGIGGGLRVEGRLNVGIFADTLPGADSVPALMGVGGDETKGTALYTKGVNVLDGDVYALRSFVGGVGAGGLLAYYPTASGQRADHDLKGSITLDSSGNATVPLPEAYRMVVNAGTMLVLLTPVGAAMPNLHVAVAPVSGSASFTVAGGSSGGKVHYAVSAERIPVSVGSVTAAATAKAKTLAAAQDSSVRARPPLTLPDR